MSFWLILFAVLVLLSIGGIIFLTSRFHRFSFIEKLGRNHKKLSWFISLIPVALIGTASYFLINLWSMIVIMLHLFIIWLICDIIAGLVRKMNGWERYRNYEGAAALIITVLYLSYGWIMAHKVFITDYDCPDEVIGKVLGEYESLSELNYLAGQIMELRESDDFWQAVLDLGENTGSVQELINLTENLDCFDYLPGVRNDYDLGYYWIEESGCYDTSNLGALANYIDYESFGRDIRYEEGGMFGDNGYVRSNGGRFVNIYDGDIESIPEEYRISSPVVMERTEVKRQTEQPER